MDATHPALADEQSFVDRAYSLLDKGLADAERSMGEFQTQHRSTALAIQRALRILRESRGTGQLVFGKLEVDGERRYIGRRRVRDEDYNPVVIGWHAPAAQLFYEASPADPRGVSLKRVFAEEERRLVRVIDEIVAASAAAATDLSGTGIAFSDALLEELDRSRDGAMRDVVATIQAEQHAIIRSPLDGVVVVQGGPGTGKTVVGLHRAAWLAFNHAELRKAGVLVVAPSTSFLTYVSGVLPSLDVTDVDQVEVQRLYAGEAAAVAEEDAETARVKGGAAMAKVLARALEQRTGWDGSDLVLTLGMERITLSGDDVGVLIEDVRGRDLAHADARDVVRDRLARLAADRHRADANASGRPARANEATIRRLSSFTNAVDRMWPGFTPEELLRSLYATQSWLVRAAEGILTADERARLFRPAAESIAAEPWTEADLYCLDELAFLLTRETVTYGHLVVDEAQDLSPMQARALARRCPSGSFTVLGDLAQATGLWERDGWGELTQHLSTGTASEHTLSIGYRVPAPVLELAARQLDTAVAVPRSIRRGLGEPTIRRVDSDSLQTAAAERVDELVGAGLSTAVVVPDEWYDAWLANAATTDVPLGDGRDGDFSQRATLVPASVCKGLEFDAVVLVEPGLVARGALQPARALYVAMTRCTQSLTVLHAAPLPRGLSDEVEEDALSGHLPDDLAVPVDARSDVRSRLDALFDALTDDDLLLVESLARRLVLGAQKDTDHVE